MLIEYLGGDPQSLQRQFEYHGDRNYYEGVKTFWRSVPSGSASDEMDFDAWRHHWERGSKGQGSEINPHLYDVQWKNLPGAERPWEDRTAADYALDPVNSADNPALRGASDGGEVGFRAGRLETPPKAPLPATTPLGSGGKAESSGPSTTIDDSSIDESSTFGNPKGLSNASGLDD